MIDYKIEDSGKRQEWTTGSKRDTQEGKPRFDLISVYGLHRLADHLAKGAEKYGERNWERGQPVSRFYASAFRHLIAWAEGEETEDHLAAVLFNVMAIIHMNEVYPSNSEINDFFSEIAEAINHGNLKGFDDEMTLVKILENGE